MNPKIKTVPPKKQKQSFTHDELRQWATDHIINGLLDGNLRMSIASVINVAIIWGRQNPKPTE
jgi:hypothetical protein